MHQQMALVHKLLFTKLPLAYFKRKHKTFQNSELFCGTEYSTAGLVSGSHQQQAPKYAQVINPQFLHWKMNNTSATHFNLV